MTLFELPGKFDQGIIIVLHFFFVNKCQLVLLKIPFHLLLYRLCGGVCSGRLWWACPENVIESSRQSCRLFMSPVHVCVCARVCVSMCVCVCARVCVCACECVRVYRYIPADTFVWPARPCFLYSIFSPSWTRLTQTSIPHASCSSVILLINCGSCILNHPSLSV